MGFCHSCLIHNKTWHQDLKLCLGHLHAVLGQLWAKPGQVGSVRVQKCGIHGESNNLILEGIVLAPVAVFGYCQNALFLLFFRFNFCNE